MDEKNEGTFIINIIFVKMKMKCSTLTGSGRALAAPSGAVVVRTPSSLMQQRTPTVLASLIFPIIGKVV